MTVHNLTIIKRTYPPSVCRTCKIDGFYAQVSDGCVIIDRAEYSAERVTKGNIAKYMPTALKDTLEPGSTCANGSPVTSRKIDVSS